MYNENHMDCIFCRIVAGELPAYVVHRDEWTVAFLDINPVNRGHCLVVPREHVASMSRLEPGLAGPLLMSVAVVALAVMRGLGAGGFNLILNDGTLAGQIIPHLHFHILPRFAGDGLNFHPRPRRLETTEMEEIRRAIAGHLPSASG